MKELPKIRKVSYGETERYSFSKLDELIELPAFLDIQKKAYKDFLAEGVDRILQEFSPVVDYSGKGKLYFLKADLSTPPKYSLKECKRRGVSYTIPLKVQSRFVVEETGEAIDQEVYLGDIPLLTEDGSFVFNGIERVVVNQVKRSPNVYFTQETADLATLKGQMIPTRGMWIEFEQGANDIIKVVLDRSSKVTVGVFLKCFGFSNKDILKLFQSFVRRNIKEFFVGEDDFFAKLLEATKLVAGFGGEFVVFFRGFVVHGFFEVF